MNYFVAGTNDMAAAIAFYDPIFARFGIVQAAQTERMTYWLGDGYAFAVAEPFDGQRATYGNGTMIGFNVGAPDQVDAIHALALELGGLNEGQPGQRGPFYSAYVRDLDGNKICFSA
ncbi:VOC family protein [Oceanicaulis sp. LC35]|uniref:VOC family protein n=1 Tax=Oceanicaulis sp. LC35 TaxID=3349635 RepID=UPI003F829FBD